MRIEYDISEQDFLNGQRLAIRNVPEIGIRHARLIAALLSAGAAGAATAITKVSSLAEIGGAVMAFIVVYFYQPWAARRKQKLLYAKSVSIKGSLAIEADENGISFLGPLSSGKVSWAVFIGYFEDPCGFILLQQNGRIFHIIPKRQLSDDEITALRELFGRHLK